MVSFEASGSGSPVVGYRDMGIVINWEKSDLHLSTGVQNQGMLIDTSLEKVFPSEAQQSHFRKVATSFLTLMLPPAHK